LAPTISDLAKNIALDEISTWRPNWDYLAWKKIYYGGFANKEVDDYNKKSLQSLNVDF
jgi:hypothetical protein